MVEHHDTKAIIRYDGMVEFSGEFVATALHRDLSRLGFVFHELEFRDALAVSVLGPVFSVRVEIPKDRPTDIEISIESEAPGERSDPNGEARFRLCVAAARAFIDILPAETVIWHHDGGCYMTEGDGALKVINAPVHRILHRSEPAPQPDPFGQAPINIG